jgi:hypothetical protein
MILLFIKLLYRKNADSRATCPTNTLTVLQTLSLLALLPLSSPRRIYLPISYKLGKSV